MGQRQANRNERRKGAERRLAPQSSRMPQAAVLLLSKLIAVLIGTLVGFLAAYLISINFVVELQDQITSVQFALDGIEQEFSKLEPEYIQAGDEYRRMQAKFENQASTTEPSAITNTPPPPKVIDGSAVEDAGSQDDPALGAVLLPANEIQLTELDEQLSQAADRFLPLKRRWERLEDSQAFWQVQLIEHQNNINQFNVLSLEVVVIFILLGYLTYPLVQRGLKHVTRQWSEILSGPESRTTQALVGFFAGLVLSMLLLLAVFSTLSIENSVFDSPLFRLVSGLVLIVVLGASGSLIGVTFFGPPPQHEDPYQDFRADAAPKILDTSVIIDGRIHDISHSGFLGGALVVTNSVLRELQALADSGDERKRVKGRQGLELIKEMQDDPRTDLRVFDDSSFDLQAHGTDEQLIIVSQAMEGYVVTNDYNLNRVAAIRDVRVLNVHALANSVKTNHLPGDFIEIDILERGSQRGQGKGYLQDGTMVVVEDGEPYIGSLKTIKLTSVTQTAQGRMLFGRVDGNTRE